MLEELLQSMRWRTNTPPMPTPVIDPAFAAALKTLLDQYHYHLVGTVTSTVPSPAIPVDITGA